MEMEERICFGSLSSSRMATGHGFDERTQLQVVYLLRADKYRRLGGRSPERQNGAAERTMMGSRRLSEPG